VICAAIFTDKASESAKLFPTSSLSATISQVQDSGTISPVQGNEGVWGLGGVPEDTALFHGIRHSIHAIVFDLVLGHAQLREAGRRRQAACHCLANQTNEPDKKKVTNESNKVIVYKTSPKPRSQTAQS